MLFKTLEKLIQINGLTDDLKNKIDIFWAAKKLSDEEYIKLTSR